MAVNYSLAHISSEPGNPDAAKKFYARMQASGEVTMDEIAEEIAYATTLTDGDVLNAVRALIRQLNKHLAAGKIVRLEQRARRCSSAPGAPRRRRPARAKAG